MNIDPALVKRLRYTLINYPEVYRIFKNVSFIVGTSSLIFKCSGVKQRQLTRDLELWIEPFETLFGPDIRDFITYLTAGHSKTINGPISFGAPCAFLGTKLIKYGPKHTYKRKPLKEKT